MTTVVPTTSDSGLLVRNAPLPLSPLVGIGIELVTFSSCRSLMVATIPYTPLPPVNVEPAPRLVGLAETTRSPEIRLRLYPPVT